MVVTKFLQGIYQPDYEWHDYHPVHVQELHHMAHPEEDAHHHEPQMVGIPEEMTAFEFHQAHHAEPHHADEEHEDRHHAATHDYEDWHHAAADDHEDWHHAATHAHEWESYDEHSDSLFKPLHYPEKAHNMA